MSKVATVEAYRAGLSAEQLVIVDRLRAAALACADGVTEHIKWNAPSFRIDGDDRITLGTDPKGQIRVILHRGVKAKDKSDFSFDAPADLVRWADKDRGVMQFDGIAMLDRWHTDVDDVFRRWMELTR